MNEFRDNKGRFIKGHPLGKRFTKGFTPWNKGIKVDHNKFPNMGHFQKHSEETKQNMSMVRKGRKLSEEHKEKISIGNKGKHSGENSPFWKGGLSILNTAIRNSSEYRQWIWQVFKRDKYICQMCGAKKLTNKIIIEPHHIKELNKILKEFLIQYSQFSPVEDKETLVRLAITYEPFWDINNGITLCRKCHKLIPVSTRFSETYNPRRNFRADKIDKIQPKQKED